MVKNSCLIYCETQRATVADSCMREKLRDRLECVLFICLTQPSRCDSPHNFLHNLSCLSINVLRHEDLPISIVSRLCQSVVIDVVKNSLWFCSHERYGFKFDKE